MNARQIGYLGSRLFALYLLFQVVPYFVSILRHYLIHHSLTEGDSPLLYFITILAFPLVMAVCVFIFWNRADMVSAGLSSGLVKTEGVSDDSGRWEKLGLMVVGAFALSDALVELAKLLAELIGRSPEELADRYGDFFRNALTYGLHGLMSLLIAMVLLLRPDSVVRLIKRLRGAEAITPNQRTD